MTINIILMALLIIAALTTVMTAKVMRAVICLAITSAVVTVLLFRLQSPIAAVFELSVCAGLIPAIFITAIGLTHRMSADELTAKRKEKLRRYWPLPVLLLIAGLFLSRVQPSLDFITQSAGPDVREMMWVLRRIDLVGQVVVLIGAAFAVAVLVKEAMKSEDAEAK